MCSSPLSLGRSNKIIKRRYWTKSERNENLNGHFYREKPRRKKINRQNLRWANYWKERILYKSAWKWQEQGSRWKWEKWSCLTEKIIFRIFENIVKRTNK